MAQVRARVRDGLLTFRNDGEERVLPVGGGAWQRWLESPSTTAFRFEHGAAHFTARRERQRGRRYWYAYRRRGGRLRKAYLGRPSDLTLERLVAAAARLDVADDRPAGHDRGRTLAADPTLGGDRHNLPSHVSSFLGRQAETAELRRVLGTTRLLTLTGAGGVGKTRLALHLAAGLLREGTDAVRLVDLATLTEPALVPQAVAQAAGTREEAGQPLLASLATGLATGRVLLILDNCEHLVAACADLTDHLLRACPNLRVLATSREPLGVPGEVAWRVPSLGVTGAKDDGAPPDPAPSDAVRLFVERARAARPDFALTERNAPAVAEVCRRLDGIPLAIELAAARVGVLAPEEIAARLDDRFRLLGDGHRTSPPRHRTLRAAVDWSYNLLPTAERRCFERLAVFPGWFALEAAEAVCTGDGIEVAALLDILAHLVDRSLVLMEPYLGVESTRYRLLETLRAYGVDRLAEVGETDRVRARHAGWVTERAEQAERAFRGPEQGRWLRWAEREHDNARAALGWAAERGETELAVRLAAALAWPWLVHQRWSEGLGWAERVLALPHAAGTRERGRLLVGAIQLTIFRGDLTSNRPGGDLGVAGRWNEECLAIGDAFADDELLLAGQGMAQLLREFGVYVEGVPEASPETGLAAARRIGHTWGERRALEALARHALRRGDLNTASARLQEAIQSAREDCDGWSLAMALNELGDVERARGAHSSAGPLYEESRAVFAELGLGDQPSLVHNLGYVALAAGDRASASRCFSRALAEFRRLGERRGMAECLIGFGAVAAAGRRPSDTGRLFGAGEAALEALGTQPWPANLPDYARWLGRARTGRTAAEFDRARAEGRELALERAAAWVLAGGSTGASAAETEPRLTPREREVARLAARGLTNRQIGEALVLAEKTAANHLHHVLSKLDLRTRTELAARAAEFGLVPTGGSHT